MTISRRDALIASGTTLAGLSLGALAAEAQDKTTTLPGSAPPAATATGDTRYPPIPLDDMYFEQRRVVNAINQRRKPSASSAGGLEGPFVPLAYTPGILDRLQALGEHCRFHTGVPAKLRELAIMITARHIGAQLEFHVHAIEAREFGFSDQNIDAIAAKRRPPKLDDDEALVYDVCMELYATGGVSDNLFARAERRFGKAVILDLVATCGYYATLGMVLNVTHATVPGVTAHPFSDLAD